MPYPIPGQTIYGGWTQEGEQYSDLKTRFSSYNTKAAGIIADGVTDTSAALQVLVTNTMQPAGGILDIVGTISIQSAVNFPANVRVRFTAGSSFKIATGVTVSFAGGFDTPGLVKVFDCAGTGNVDLGPGRLPAIYPEWWGCVADGVSIDTLPFGKAISAQVTTVSVNTPAGGILTAYITPIVLCGATYLLDSTMNCGGYFNMVSYCKSAIKMTDGTKATLLMGNSFKCVVAGIQFFGGKHAIQFYNNNIDTSRVTIRDCQFQLTTDVAIRLGGSGTAAGGPAVNSSIATLAATVNGFTRLAGSFITDGFTVGMILTPQGFSDNMISQITAVTALSITVNDARLAEVSAAARNLEGTYANDTQSTSAFIENCEFYYCTAVLKSHADQVTMKECSVYLSNALTPANTPQIVNYGFGMTLDEFFGVPFPAGTPVASRWIDNYSRIWIKNPRFGAENGGIPVVWHRGAPSASGTDAQGTAVEIEGGFAFGGAANPTGGVIIFRENVPELIRIEGVRGLGTTGVLVEGPASAYAANINTNTYLAAFGVNLYNRFRVKVDANLINAPFAFPAAIKQLLARRWDQMLVESLLTGAIALNQATAVPLIDVSFDTTGGNDDAIGIEVRYMVEDAGGANRNIEQGFVTFVAVRNAAGVTIGVATKSGASQALSTGVTNAIAFTAVVVGGVVTLKCTATTSNGDSSNIVFSARISKPLIRALSSVAVSAGVAWDQAGA